MITVETNTQTEQEVREAMHAHGYTPTDEVAKPEETAPPAEGETTPAPGEPGGETAPAETGGSAAEGEAEVQTQETTPTETTKPKAKGGYQARIEKQTKKIDSLSEELDNERVDKTRLAGELEEAKTELERLRAGAQGTAKEPKEPAGPVRPKRPVMPELAELDFDMDKFQAALKEYRTASDKYEVDMEAYQTALTQKTTTEALAAREREASEKQVKEANDKAFNSFVERKDRDAKEIGDAYGDMLENEPAWPEIFQVSIVESEQPGHLMFYFYEHPEEMERIQKMTDHLGRPNLVRQAAAIGRIEDKIASGSETTPPATEKKPAAVEPPKPKPQSPAPPKPRAETPEPPLTTLGSRAPGGVPFDYETALKAAADAGNGKEFQRLRAEQHKAKFGKRAG